MNHSLETQVLHGNAKFTNDLYQMLAKQDGNIFFSPISIHAVLSMVYQGAQEDTAQALLRTLTSPKAEGYKSVMNHLNSIKDVKLLMANKIYGNKNNKKFRKEFESVVVENFGSEVELLDFEDRKGAAKTINSWVEAKTMDKIKDIVNERILNRNLSLILINAIYFKGEWFSKFTDSSTRTEKFYLGKDETVEVKMMYQKNRYQYKHDEELGAQIIEIPYKGRDTKMMIILPSENSIKDLEAKLATTDLMKISDNMASTDIHLFLPKFKMEETMELNEILSKMGLANIFDKDHANFGGILELTHKEDNLYVNEVVHKAFIEVNETGTEASAATRVSMAVGCAPGMPKVVTFRVDRPAIFMLVALHDNARSILFYGRLSRPSY